EGAVGHRLLGHGEARPRVPLEMAHLELRDAAGPDVETAVAPLVPDRRQHHAAVLPVGRQDGDDRKLEEVTEVVDRKPRPRADIQSDRVVAAEVSDVMALLTTAIRDQDTAVDDLLLTTDPALAADYEGAVEAEIRNAERLRQLASSFPDEYPGVAEALQAVG